MTTSQPHLETASVAADGRVGLTQSLRRFRGRMLLLGIAASVAWGLSGLVAGLIVGSWADLVFELSPGLRITVIVVASAASMVLLAMLTGRLLQRSKLLCVARRLDGAAGTNGEIVAAADLLTDSRSRSPLGRGLAQLAINRAAAMVAPLELRRAVPNRPLSIALGSLVSLAIVVGAAFVVAPLLVKTEYLRFLDPYGDHPPYSRVSFQVDPGNADVIYGASREIKVITSGTPVDRLNLVLLPPEGGPEETLPMFGEPGGVWRATVASVTAPTRYFVRCDTGRSHRFRLGVITLPKLEAVRFRITPPAYTNRGAYEGGLPQGGLAGLRGTTVQVWAKSNRPLSGGSLRLMGTSRDDEGVAVSMKPSIENANEVTASFEIREPGRIELRVRDIEGQASQDSFATPVAVRNDERPFIRLVDPPPVSLSTPGTAVPVVLAAEDDYGISRLSLYRSLNDSRALPVDMPVPDSPPATRQNQASGLPLSAYGLRPGDEIKLFARVEDNDPVGAKGTESPIALIRIISQEEYERLVLVRQGLELLVAKYEQARRRMEDVAAQVEELQKELAKSPEESQLSSETRQKFADLAKKMQEQSKAMAEAAESKLPFDIDESMNEHLRELAEKLDKAGQELDAFAKTEPAPTNSEAREGLEVLKKFLKQNKEEYEENTTEPLEYLAKVYPLKEDEERFTALYQRQKELADRLESLRDKDGTDDPQLRARMRDLESEQYKVREDLRNLLQAIEDHIQQLPDNPEVEQLRETATMFVNGVRDSGAADAMAEAEAGLAEYSGTRGAAEARRAERILSEFIGKCQNMGQSGASCLKFAPGLGENLGNTVDQLLAGKGLSTGQGGMGMAGGGYSAQSSTLDNVGLFGSLPALGGGERAGDAKQSSSALLGARGQEGNFERGEPGYVDPLDPLRATGAGQNLVPPQYRQRVGAYFERITNETGERKDAK